jgi:hypothetical protein
LARAYLGLRVRWRPVPGEFIRDGRAAQSVKYTACRLGASDWQCGATGLQWLAYRWHRSFVSVISPKKEGKDSFTRKDGHADVAITNCSFSRNMAVSELNAQQMQPSCSTGLVKQSVLVCHAHHWMRQGRGVAVYMNVSGLLRLEKCLFLADSPSIATDEVDPSEPVSDCAAVTLTLRFIY